MLGLAKPTTSIALGLAAFIIFANLHMVQPLLPVLANDFQLSDMQASWLVNITMLSLAMSFAVCGPLSDMFGRKLIMVISLFGVTVITLLLAHANSYTQLFWLRAFLGLFLGGMPAVAVAYIGEEYDPRTLIAVIGLYISSNSLGGIGGRVIGGTITAYWEWSVAFYSMAILSLLVSVYFLVALPSSTQFIARPVHIQSVLKAFISNLSNKRLLLAYAVGGLHFGLFLNVFSYAVFHLSAAPYQLSSQALGLIFLTYLPGAIVSAFSGKLADRLTRTGCIMWGSALISAGLLMTVSSSLVVFIVGLTLMSTGFFLAHSNLSSWVNYYAVQAKATASALYLIFFYLGASVGAFYLHPFWSWKQWSGIVIGALVLSVTTFYLGHVMRKNRS